MATPPNCRKRGASRWSELIVASKSCYPTARSAGCAPTDETFAASGSPAIPFVNPTRSTIKARASTSTKPATATQ